MAMYPRHNSQEDVFADCRGLIASAVDGFNVTVWGGPSWSSGVVSRGIDGLNWVELG